MPILILLLGIFAIGYGIAWAVYEAPEDRVLGGVLFGMRGVIAIAALVACGLLSGTVELNDPYGDSFGLKHLFRSIFSVAYLVFAIAFGIAQVVLKSLQARLFGGLIFGVAGVTFSAFLYFVIAIVFWKR